MFDNIWKWVIELMATLMFTCLLYKDIIKDIDEHPVRRDVKGKVRRVPRKDLPPLWSRGGPPSQHMDVHQPGSSPNPTLGIFITKAWEMANSVSSSSSFPGEWEVELNIPRLPFRTKDIAITWEIVRNLGALCQELGSKIKYKGKNAVNTLITQEITRV